MTVVLPEPLRPHHPDDAAGLQRERHRIEGGRPVRPIGEADILEGDLAAQGRAQAAARPFRLRRPVHHLAEHPDRERHLLVLVRHGEHLDQRARDAAGQHVEGDERTHGQRAVEHIERAEPDDRDGGELFEQARHGLRDGRDPLDTVAHLHRLRRGILPLPALQRLHRQGLDGPHPLDRFDQQRLALALRVVERLEPAPERPDQGRDGERDQPREGEHHERQLRAVEQQDGDEDEERAGIERRGEEAPGQEFPHPGGLLHVLDQDARRHLLEMGERQAEEMREGLHRHADVDAVRGVEQQVAPQEREAGLEHEGQDDAAGEHGQGGIGFVGQHPVDDELREQRDGEPDGVERERRHDHVGEEPALAQDLWHEPQETERPAPVRRAAPCLRAHQQHLAGPGGAEGRLVEEERLVPGGLRVEHDQARRLGVAVGAGDDDPVAVPEMRERREGAAEIGEARKGQAGAAGPEPTSRAIRVRRGLDTASSPTA